MAQTTAKLYQFAIIKQGKKDSKGNLNEKPTLVIEPTTILASDDSQAQLLAGRAIPEEHLDDLDRLTIVVRPF